MSFLDSVNGVDARGSNFYDIGGDQIFNFYRTFSTDQIFDQLPTPTAETLRLPISNPEELIQRRALALAYLSPTGSGPDDIPRLIANIISLIDHGSASCAYDPLKLELELLHQTLVFSALGVKAYQCTQLGQSLTAVMNPELVQCVDVLQDLFRAIQTYRQGLWFTPIRSLWHKVWRSGCEIDELVLWKRKLHARRTSLATIVMAMRSISWTPLGNELRSGRVFLSDFRTAVNYGPPSLHDVQVCKVLVVDHLGENISVPAIFCSSWKCFNYIISGYCNNRPGYRYVKSGDYQVICADSSQVISPSEFNIVRPGTCLEMSIILRQRTASDEDKGKCPRCRYMNSVALGTDNWIDWKVILNSWAWPILTKRSCSYKCDKRFRVFQTDEDPEDNPADNDEQHDQERSGGSQAADDRREMRNTGQDDGDEEITSPASRPRANTTNRLPHIQKKAQPHDDDDILQFRRVSLLFWAGSVAAQTAHLSVDALTSPAFIFGNIEPFGSEHLSVDAFSSAALRAFTILEPWLAAQKCPGHPLIISVVDAVVEQAKSLRSAVRKSLQTANDGISLADDAITLCELLIRGQDSRKDTAVVVNSMVEIVTKACNTAKAISNQFRSIRSGLSQVRKRIPDIVSRINRMKAEVVILPTPLLQNIPAEEPERMQQKSRDHAREKEEKNISDVAVQLNRAHEDVSQLITHAGHFIDWWGELIIGLHGLQTVLGTAVASNPLRLKDISKRWLAIREQYVLYSQRMTLIEDTFSKTDQNTQPFRRSLRHRFQRYMGQVF